MQKNNFKNNISYIHTLCSYFLIYCAHPLPLNMHLLHLYRNKEVFKY